LRVGGLEHPGEQATFIKPSSGVIEIEQLPSMPSARNHASATRIDESGS
jgi:hypothetical protein